MIATLLSAFRVAIGAILRNKLRAALTVLGIFIGISAVVIVTAAGTSATNLVGGEIDALAANALFVFPHPVAASGAKSKTVGRITEADGRAIIAGAAAVGAVAP
ncbi:MAG TPA: ABC transporter permease, partial [Polyangiaceae bacterium]|nr:ABC transporter permease [Polyangiaceae bacterium]